MSLVTPGSPARRLRPVVWLSFPSLELLLSLTYDPTNKSPLSELSPSLELLLPESESLPSLSANNSAPMIAAIPHLRRMMSLTV